MQNSLRPSIRQPDSVRVAGARAGEVLAWLADGGGQYDAVAGDLLERGGEAAYAALLSGRDRHLAAALHVEHRDEVHVHADRDRGVASCQAARRHHQVVRGRHAEPAQLDRHGRGEVARRLERLDRLEGVAAVAVVLGRAGGELRGKLFGDRHEAGAGLGTGCQFDRHGGISNPRATPVAGATARPRACMRAQSVATSTATGTPLVTMS